MIDPSYNAYSQLLKQFYRNSIKKHSNRGELMKRMLNNLQNGSQYKQSAKYGHFSRDNGLDIEQSKRFSPTKSGVSQNRSMKLRTAKSNKQVDPNERQSRNQLRVSTKKFGQNNISSDRKFSNSSRSISQISDLERGDPRKNKQQQKYFNCQWLYKGSSFKKVFCYAVIYLFLEQNDIYNFTKLTENINSILEEKNNMNPKDIAKVSSQWSKMNQTFNKKDKVRWNKIIPQIFINFEAQFIDIVFDSLTCGKIDLQQAENPNKQMIQHISRIVKVRISYFEIFYKEMKTIIPSQSSQIQLILGYSKQDEKFLFSNKFPQKSEKQLKKQKVANNITQAIADLLKQYQINTQKLVSLDILLNGGDKQQKLKAFQ